MTLSALVTVVLVLVILGFCLWLLEKYVPQDSVMVIVIRVVVIICVVLWLLSLIGLWHGPILR